jgi:hypothetical protein
MIFSITAKKNRRLTSDLKGLLMASAIFVKVNVEGCSNSTLLECSRPTGYDSGPDISVSGPLVEDVDDFGQVSPYLI